MRRILHGRIGGLILLAWGSFVISKGFLNGVPGFESAYDAGRTSSYLFSWALVGAGLSLLIGKRRQRGPDDLDLL